MTLEGVENVRVLRERRATERHTVLSAGMRVILSGCGLGCGGGGDRVR